LVKKSHIYWYCQVFGWFFYILSNSVYIGLISKSSNKVYLLYFFSLLFGILVTHLYRSVIIKFKVIESKIPAQLLIVFFSSIFKAIVFFTLTNLVSLFLGLITLKDLTLIFFTESISSFSVVFALWNIFYFGFHYFQNYKRTEINSLRYLAASKESELKSLKAQLNPHFIFNCMNSIRALIDENPVNAKNAVTQLSNILRNTLLMDNSKEIFLKEEINLVKDYLDLEKIRYEERLCFEFDIDEEILTCHIPPFIIQSQVENAIKHGIAIQPGPGTIKISALKRDNSLEIKVSNSGKLGSETPLTGVGFKNSLQRLQLLYGASGKIIIYEDEHLVVVAITIPIRIK